MGQYDEPVTMKDECIVELPEQSIFDVFEKSTRKHASHTAVIDGEKQVTFSELKDASEYLAAALYHKDFQKGDRLALMLPNSLEYITTFFAVHRLGGTIVQVNPMYQPQELEHILKDSEAAWFVGYEKEKEKLKKIDGLQYLEAIYVDASSGDSLDHLIRRKIKDLPDIDIDLKEDVAVFQYTGGTTGLPKGAMLTHSNIVSNIHQTYHHIEEIYSQSHHKLLGTAPMYHAMGMTNMFLCLTIGGTYIAVERFKAHTAIEIIRKHQPTLFLGSPTMYIALLNDETLQQDDLRCFKLCVCGSAPMPNEVIKQFDQATDALFTEGYGLSEATTSTHRNPTKGKKKVGSVGVPIPNTKAKIVDVETGKTEMPIGESGELIVKGPQVMKGYWNNPEETENAKRNGWLYTGDIAVKDEDGYYFIVGRKKDMIIAGGYNIYPAEIENVIYEHPAVQEACVFGVPDPYRGETVKVAIVEKEPMTEEDITNWCAERLAKYKVPKIIEFRGELPKTTVGKILRRQLVEEAKTQGYRM
ncbi:long-chain fatty acid--CoA ligase [Lentibacillus sp. L22]|uniref:long-chain-fatty-acid--CoA ligase n=1 Tax=Lentibacillus sp. L22 TaxID=3163028 RepID=UPI0034670F46